MKILDLCGLDKRARNKALLVLVPDHVPLALLPDNVNDVAFQYAELRSVRGGVVEQNTQLGGHSGGGLRGAWWWRPVLWARREHWRRFDASRTRQGC